MVRVRVLDIPQALALLALISETQSRHQPNTFFQSSTGISAPKHLLVVGSLNVDSIIEVDRFPSSGETVVGCDSGAGITGGKGANQAVAAARLTQGRGRKGTQFVGNLGNDQYALDLVRTLNDHAVDTDGCEVSATSPTGKGLVFLKDDGTIASVVVGGSNAAWPPILMQEADYPDTEESAHTENGSSKPANSKGLAGLASRIRGACCVLLQSEVPEWVNEAVAAAAARTGVPVFLDAGGEDRPLSVSLMRHATFLTPNLTELRRLSGRPELNFERDPEAVVAAARALQDAGAKNVLVTLGDKGSLLVCEARGEGEEPRVIRTPCCPLPQGCSRAVDETGAGDCFRAAFAVALAEGEGLERCLRFASAAGALAVTKRGAVPSVPSREECDALLSSWEHSGTAFHSAQAPADGEAAAANAANVAARALLEGGVGETEQPATVPVRPSEAISPKITRGGAVSGSEDSAAAAAAAAGTGSPGTREDGAPPSAPPLSASACPWKFASRLNSMKDRLDLWDADRWGSPAAAKKSVRGWVARQGSIRGLSLVDFNFPQHLKRLPPPPTSSSSSSDPSASDGSGHIDAEEEEEEEEEDGRLSVSDAKAALAAAGLEAGAVCLRYPSPAMRAGALTHPDPGVRAQAVALTVEAGRAALALGAREVVVWSAFDGYDYALQVDHPELWQRIVDGFREVCDALPEVRVSLEFKPTDEHTRFFAVPSTGAALLLCRDVDRANFGLTLDVGHCLAAGENPAQSVAMALREGKLFGVQMNDGYTRLGAEDGLVFGSVHPGLALELCVWLVKGGFDGHVYFDTFPGNEDPVRECEMNIGTAKRLWAKATALLASPDLARCWGSHDGLGALSLLGLAQED